jgi:hypothetical protein
MHSRRHGLGLLVSVAVLGGAIAFPLGVLAAHRFTDVPASNTFHDDIAAIADAGVTTGCSPNLYCPEQFVTREQMAAFLNRLGALAPGKTPVVNATRLDGLDSAQFARSDQPRSGQATCAGSMLLPFDTAVAYNTVFNLIYTTTAPGNFRCQFHLPDGATITSFNAGLQDESTTESTDCGLVRHSLTNVTSASLAHAATATDENVGRVVRVDDSIAQPVVDNTAFTYSTQCSISGFGGDVGIFGATVEYEVTGPALE